MAVVRTKAGVFRKDSYDDANNDIAISKVIKYLESKGMRCEYKDEEDFDIDLICYKGKKEISYRGRGKNTYFKK